MSYRRTVLERIAMMPPPAGPWGTVNVLALDSAAGALAFVIPPLRNPIWVRLQRGAPQPASERGYVVMIMGEPGHDPQPPASYRYLVEESRADGLLLAPGGGR